MTTELRWDFFIAHAGADLKSAERLYHLLGQRRVFLDSRCLKPGDNWDESLSRAQRQSAITVVLISHSTEEAFYQREEIAAALALARRSPDDHRVVPLYLDRATYRSVEIPYGLRLKHAIILDTPEALPKAAGQLLSLVAEGADAPEVMEPAVAVRVLELTKSNNPSGASKGVSVRCRVKLRREHLVAFDLEDNWTKLKYKLQLDGDTLTSGEHGLLERKRAEQTFAVEDREIVFKYRKHVVGLSASATIDKVELFEI